MDRRPLKKRAAAVVTLGLLAGPAAQGGDLRYSVALGFGGTGITTDVTLATGTTTASKSEGPGIFAVGVDYPVADRWNIGAEHARGFRLGPFSSGVGFTGFYARWYFLGSQAVLSSAKPENTTLFVRSIAMFMGPSAGVANGTITREGEPVDKVSESGVFVGYRLGADYALSHKHALRPEMIYSTTISGTGKVQEFALQCAFVFTP